LASFDRLLLTNSLHTLLLFLNDNYLANLPTLQKKLRVMADWTLDIFFKRDVTMLKTFLEGGRDADSDRTDRI
jgi:hypothetical protein